MSDVVLPDSLILTPSALAPIPSRVNLAVFASGTGTNFRAICEAARSGLLDVAEPMLLVCNRDCPAMQIAEEFGVPAMVISPKDFETAEAWMAAITDQLHAYEIDFVALAGFLRIVGPPLLDAFENRILNLHPALLPAYPGLHSIEHIWRDAHGSDETLAREARDAAGVTVHLIDSGMDTGPVLRQGAIDLDQFGSVEDFEAAVHALEHELFPAVIADFARNFSSDKE